jgi:hypothetical protein
VATPAKFGPVLTWQRRALGVFWALVGLLCFYDLLARDFWQSQKLTWVPLLVGAVCFSTGVGFLMGAKLAGRVMWGVVLLAAFEFLQSLALGLFKGTSLFTWVGIAGLAVTAYTILLLIISAWETDRNTEI